MDQCVMCQKPLGNEPRRDVGNDRRAHLRCIEIARTQGEGRPFRETTRLSDQSGEARVKEAELRD